MSTFNIPNHERDFQSMMIPKGKRQSDMSQVTRSPHRSINTTDGQQKKKKSGSDQERSKRPTDDVVNSFDQSGMHESSAGEHFSQMMNEKYSINIGSKKIQFDIRDPIFQLAKANPQTIPSNACFSCEKDLSTKKQHDFCQFCGNRACQICMHKERAFPGVKAKITQKKPKGKICKVCDRKFILYNTYSEYAQQIEQQDQLIKIHYQELEPLNNEVASKVEKLQNIKANIEQETKRFGDFEFHYKTKIQEYERKEDMYQSDVQTMKLLIKTKETELQFKKLDHKQAEDDIKSVEQVIHHERSFLEKHKEKLQKIKENIEKQQVKVALSRSQALPSNNIKAYAAGRNMSTLHDMHNLHNQEPEQVLLTETEINQQRNQYFYDSKHGYENSAQTSDLQRLSSYDQGLQHTTVLDSIVDSRSKIAKSQFEDSPKKQRGSKMKQNALMANMQPQKSCCNSNCIIL